MTERLSGAAARAAFRLRIARTNHSYNYSRTWQAESSIYRLGSQGVPSSRPFASTSSTFFGLSSLAQAGGSYRETARQKRHERDALRGTRIARRREKDNYRPPRITSSDDRPRNKEREELEAQIQAYFAATGPKGERLNLKEKEKLLEAELGTLGKELDNVDKKVKADEETAHLPPLDDNVLSEIYQALMLPPPPSGEETRLARLASGRREQMLLESSRGRKELEEPTISSLPPSSSDRNRDIVSRSLKQKLIHATLRSRMLLPPTAQSTPPTETQLAEAEEKTEILSDASVYVDPRGLPKAERQEIHLQQLFARLALVQSSAQSSESLHTLRSSLAQRIAKILESHQYQLPTRFGEQDETRKNSIELADKMLSAEFEPLRLDMAASVPEASETDTPPAESEMAGEQPDIALPVEARKHAELVVKAESMLENLGSPEARTFMLDGIERLLPPTNRSAEENAARTEAGSGRSSTAPRVPLGVASPEEWTALAVSSARADDWISLLRTLSLMERAGYFPPPLALYNNLLDVFAAKGDVASCLQIVSFITKSDHTANDYTYHSLTKVYIETAQFAKAIELLNSLEEQSRPAAMATYTLLISKLIDFANPDSANPGRRPELQSLAWSVFYHMRLVAHPVPDAPLYALMIRACARGIPQPHDIDDPSNTYTSLTRKPSQAGSGFAASQKWVSEAERALDLFREMTTRYNVRPNAEVYNSLILACARRKDFYLEAFRLLREMVGLENERVGLFPGASDSLLRFAPDRFTFNALLQGCARSSDLPRARWVLAEMIRTTLPLFDDAVRPQLSRAQKVEMLAKRPNVETLCHLFYTYASFVPAVSRENLRLQQKDDTRSSAGEEPLANPTSTEPLQDSPSTMAAARISSEIVAGDQDKERTTAEEAAHVFSALVPQTSEDVISEARSLFARVLADQPQNGIEGPLGAVKPNIRLVNAYLAVLAAHLDDSVKVRIMGSVLFGESRTGPLMEANLVLRSGVEGNLDRARSLEDSLLARLGLAPNEHTFRIFLQAYSTVPKQSERAMQELAEQIQVIWAKFNDYVYGSSKDEAYLDHRKIKLCWTAYIHFWAKHAELQPLSDDSEASDSGDSALPGLDMAMATLRRFAHLYPPRLPEEPSNSIPPATSPLFGPLGSSKSIKNGDKTDRMLNNLDLSPLPAPQKSLESLRVLAEEHSSGRLPPRDSCNKAESPESMSNVKASVNEPQSGESLPTLAFVDVDVLHHRLVRYSRTKDLAYLGWFLRSSAAASRPRRMRY